MYVVQEGFTQVANWDLALRLEPGNPHLLSFFRRGVQKSSFLLPLILSIDLVNCQSPLVPERIVSAGVRVLNYYYTLYSGPHNDRVRWTIDMAENKKFQIQLD